MVVVLQSKKTVFWFTEIMLLFGKNLFFFAWIGLSFDS